MDTVSSAPFETPLGERGVIDLRIMPDTGMESSAVWVFGGEQPELTA